MQALISCWLLLGVRLCSACWLTTAVNPCTRSLFQLSARNITFPWWRLITTRNLESGLDSARLTKREKLERLLAAPALLSKTGVWKLKPPKSFSTTWRSNKFSNEHSASVLTSCTHALLIHICWNSPFRLFPFTSSAGNTHCVTVIRQAIVINS